MVKNGGTYVHTTVVVLSTRNGDLSIKVWKILVAVRTLDSVSLDAAN